VKKETHAAPGRQVSTWAHAIKATKVRHVECSLLYFVILRLSSLGSGMSEPFSSTSAYAYPHAPLESVIRESNCAGVRLLFLIPMNYVWSTFLPRYTHAYPRNHPTGGKTDLCVL
jgi:hypothetical protein